MILDVVYNHTAEGGPDGPTYSFRGLDDLGYYKRAGTGADAYWDVTGCGNTVDTTNLGALRLILDSLRYWVTEMHVDGFRFDLASALARTGHEIDMRGAFLTTIGQDPVLRHVKLIAEPWDASMDGYRVGSFPPPWVEWNDRYRDTLRDFWRPGHGSVREVASRLAGSSDLYADDGRSPYASVNFVTAHDGFTLRDWTTYDHKHNEANGEDNRDGTDGNRSWNCGVEGETDDAEVVARRHRLAANMMATLCLSSGSPMITAGDERGRTQRGNNNAYVQDNEVSWVDWRPDDAWLDLYEITKTALRLRREHPALRQRHHFAGSPDHRRRPQGPRVGAPRGSRDAPAGLVRRRARGRRHVRLGRPAPLPRSARRAAARRVVPAVVQRRRGAGRGACCPTTSGCSTARSCCPPTPTCPTAPPSTPASDSASAGSPSSCSARPADRAVRAPPDPLTGPLVLTDPLTGRCTTRCRTPAAAGADRSRLGSRMPGQRLAWARKCPVSGYGRATTPSSAGEASRRAAGTTRTV